MQEEDILSLKVQSVKEFSLNLKNLLEEKFAYIWIKGEIGPVKIHSSGHIYFSLKEDDYVINAICWKGTITSNPIEEGSIVECYGKITTYPGRSSYQIIAKEIKQVNKQGNIFLQLEELKQKLTKEGLFDLSKKKKIPEISENIAILTSPTGAVFHDIMHRINHRFPCCNIHFFHIPVQNDQSIPFIVKALKKANEIQSLDLIILARGGGSLEDLWVFNNEEVVRCIASLKVPIISAIGHETDTTLSDFAADLRAPTPTAAAEIAVPDKNEIIKNLLIKEHNLRSLFEEKIKKYKLILNNLIPNKNDYLNTIGSLEQKIDNLILDFKNKILSLIHKKKNEIGQKLDKNGILDKLEDNLNQNFEKFLIIKKNRLQFFKDTILQQKTFFEEKKIELENKIIISDLHKKTYKSAYELRHIQNFNLNFLDGVIEVEKKLTNS